jgi:hypothetical protein
MFDTVTPFHYSDEDRQRGFIVARDRSRKVRKAALMSVSIAVVNRHHPEEFKSTVQINEKVAEIKHYLKEIPGSKFMADRRNTTVAPLHGEPQVYEKKEKILSSYRPLGQILLERKQITQEQLDEALKIHWRRDVILGEALKDLGLIKEEILQEALKIQQERITVLT